MYKQKVCLYIINLASRPPCINLHKIWCSWLSNFISITS